MKTKIPSKTRSILRYPGSKARLAKIIADIISINRLDSPLLLEPFCGGASVSIALLESNVVSSIALNDVDPLISSLWKCVFSSEDSKWLAEKVMEVPLTLDYWSYQKKYTPVTTRESALKCLYLNRTSFSGVLQDRAGPIGGKTQKKWTVGCRFNREKLSVRINELSKLSNRVVSVTNKPWLDFCQDWVGHQNVAAYLDPPFYHKAERLYRYWFNAEEHVHLNNHLKNMEIPWILSYDNAGEIRKIYSGNGFNVIEIDNTYSAHPMGGNSFIGKEIILSNLKDLPIPPARDSGHAGLSVRAHSNNISGGELLRIPMPSL